MLLKNDGSVRRVGFGLVDRTYKDKQENLKNSAQWFPSERSFYMGIIGALNNG